MDKQRLIYKIGTSSLTKKDGSLDPHKIQAICQQVAQLHQAGHAVVLVTSGSIAAGFRRMSFNKRPRRIAEKQAAAAVGQGLLIEEYTQALWQYKIVSAQILLTQDDFRHPSRYQNAKNALEVLINKRVVPIINENDTVATEEIKVGDNDSLSAQVAALVHADLLVLLTDVPGLYTANPNTDPKAQHLATIDAIGPDHFRMAQGTGSANGTGGMTTKLTAAQLATKAGTPVFICRADDPDALILAVNQTNQGTYFKAKPHPIKQRKQWLSFYASTQGAIYIDQGAEAALLNKGSSLLVQGVHHIETDFEQGAIISVYDHSGHYLLGKGKTRLSADQIKNDTFESPLLIHRDDWISYKDHDIDLNNQTIENGESS